MPKSRKARAEEIVGAGGIRLAIFVQAPEGFRYAHPGYTAIISRKTVPSDWRHDVR
jgi:hypothetical protein